jgi:hypothetical protein
LHALVQTFTRNLRDSDFTRFNFYAQRIKCLNYLPYGWHEKVKIPYDLVLLSTIQHYLHDKPEGTGRKALGLSPNLRTLEFGNPIHASFAPEVFLGAKLVTLSLAFIDQYDDLEVKSLFSLIKTHSPKMEHLALE